MKEHLTKENPVSVMTLTGALEIGNQHEVIVEGPVIVVFANGQFSITIGDTFDVGDAARSVVVGYIVGSVARLVADEGTQQQLLAVSQRLIGTVR